MNLPKIGDNTQSIDFAAQETDRLNQDFGYLHSTVEELLSEAAAFDVVEDDAAKSKVMSLIKKIRDQSKTILGIHELEKIPPLRRGQAIDNFFFGLADKLAKRARNNRDGEADRLNRILTDYDARVLAAEQERRRKEWEEQERIRRAAEEARLKAEREAEERRLAAERARKPETQAAKEQAAQAAEEAASSARVEETVAHAKAEEAYVETLARPADIMRTRTADGTLGTMGEEPFAEIVDRNKLDLEKLRPHLPAAALETALRAYAKANAYSPDASVQIAGARFGKRPKSRVR